MPDLPKYRIQTVESLTGVPSGTLRAWERRYGVPKPERSGNRYRLYSEDDVAAVRSMQKLCEDGLAPSEAARVLQKKIDAGEALTLPEPDQTWPSPVVGQGPWDAMAAAIVDAGMAFDASRMQAVLQRLLLMGPATEIFDRAILPALRMLGDRWEQGTLGIGEEHFVTHAVATVTRGLVITVQPSEARRRLLVACVRDEAHVLPLDGVALHAARRGWRTASLGANSPPEALATAIARQKPDAVALSMTYAGAEAPGDWVAEYAQACAATPWIVGGHAAVADADRVRAAGGVVAKHYTDLIDFLARIDPLAV